MVARWSGGLSNVSTPAATEREMTTYERSLAIGDSEYLALEAALRLMIDHCEAQIASGAGAPYWAHKQSCAKMLQRLATAPTQMTSTNTFLKG